MSKQLEKMIAQGEHQQQDFKYAITDSRKIAKSLVAFANTDGGKLLIGVKDNGAVVGVADEEEFYMIEAAAQMYCKPVVEFTTSRHETRRHKTVLEINIPKSKNGPHYAQDDDGKWWAYQRIDDENILADKVQLAVWKRRKSNRGTFIRYSETERNMLEFLNENGQTTLRQLARAAKAPSKKVESVLVQLIITDVVKMNVSDQGVYYQINKKKGNNPTQKKG